MTHAMQLYLWSQQSAIGHVESVEIYWSVKLAIELIEAINLDSNVLGID